jgi:hypothetical protein
MINRKGTKEIARSCTSMKDRKHHDQQKRNKRDSQKLYIDEGQTTP